MRCEGFNLTIEAIYDAVNFILTYMFFIWKYFDKLKLEINRNFILKIK